MNAQGEDVVAGVRTPQTIDQLAEVMPEAYKQLVDICAKLAYLSLIHIYARCKWLPAAPLLLALNVFSTLLGGFSLRECSTTGAVAAAKYPILFIHGKADDFVPTRMSQEAYDACASEKRLVLIDGAAHAKSYITDPARCV